mgnify:CR=1 FL=1|jgi:hypothetical protein
MRVTRVEGDTARHTTRGQQAMRLHVVLHVVLHNKLLFTVNLGSINQSNFVPARPGIQLRQLRDAGALPNLRSDAP